MATSAERINARRFISGSYDDAATTHGFVRAPNGQFHNFDFPGADATVAVRLNDFGQVAGQYFTNFPSRGFILTGGMS
jgi:hypothetical protein